MHELTGLYSHDWVAFLGLALALMLAVQAGRRSLAGLRIGGLLIIPLIGSGALVALVLLLYRERTIDILATIPSRPVALLVAAGTLIVALALVDYVFARVVPLAVRLSRWLRLPRFIGPDAALATALVAILVGLGTTSVYLQPLAGASIRLAGASIRVFELPGQPMDLLFVDQRSGYLSMAAGRNGEGSILRLELDGAGTAGLSWEIVAEDLVHPRGIAISGSELFVAELGPMPCSPSFPRCTGDEMRPADPLEGELEIISSARGRVSRYPILPDGSLGPPRLVLTDLPVVGTEHGVNGITLGPDGNLYMAVGHVDSLWRSPERLDGLTPHPEWLGSILRFTDDGGEPEIFARGLRNVYQIVFDDLGDMWVVDNDGPTLGGWRAEEVLKPREGRHYGYPYDGTFGPRSVRDDGPTWLISQGGTAGIAWSESGANGPGLLIGSCGVISTLSLPEVDGERAPWSEFGAANLAAVPVVLQIPGCVSALESAGEKVAVAAIYTWQGSGLLYLIELTRDPA